MGFPIPLYASLSHSHSLSHLRTQQHAAPRFMARQQQHRASWLVVPCIHMPLAPAPHDDVIHRLTGDSPARAPPSRGWWWLKPGCSRCYRHLDVACHGMRHPPLPAPQPFLRGGGLGRLGGPACRTGMLPVPVPVVEVVFVAVSPPPAGSIMDGGMEVVGRPRTCCPPSPPPPVRPACHPTAASPGPC